MHIVLALDGSPSSVRARDLVANLRWPEGSVITAMSAYAVPIAWVAGTGMAGDWLTTAEDELRKGLSDELDTLAAPLEGHGWTVERRLVEGRPATAILAVAAEVKADLIVLGSRGNGPMRAMLLGSVSAEVSDQAACSVLLARRDGVGRMLVATDGSECASIIPGVLAEWQALGGIPTTVVSVAPVDSPAFELMVSLYTLGADQAQGQREELVATHARAAEDMAARLTGFGIPAEAVVRSGDAAHEIVNVAAERGVDLVVTGSRCLHGVERWVLGSVARNVVMHAAASVLVVRGPAEG